MGTTQLYYQVTLDLNSHGPALHVNHGYVELFMQQAIDTRMRYFDLSEIVGATPGEVHVSHLPPSPAITTAVQTGMSAEQKDRLNAALKAMQSPRGALFEHISPTMQIIHGDKSAPVANPWPTIAEGMVTPEKMAPVPDYKAIANELFDKLVEINHRLDDGNCGEYIKELYGELPELLDRHEATLKDK